MQVRVLKMGWNQLANMTYHGFRPDWVEKTEVLPITGQNEPDSFNLGVIRVQHKLMAS